MPLDLTSLEKAVVSLGKALTVAASARRSAVFSETEKDVIRAGVIQNFEFTYELCWKFMKRWLEASVGEAYVEGMSRRELFRMAAEQHLIDDVERWFDYHEARNETAHTYDADKAEEISAKAVGFHGDAMKFLAALKERNDRS